MLEKSWPQKWTLPALTRPLSLKFRLTALNVGLFVLFIWAMVAVSVTVLEGQLQQLLARQQLAATAQLARELENKLKDDINGLTRAAAGLPGELSFANLQPLLAQRPLMHVAFSGGITVIGLDGVVIADYPVAPGRRGGHFADRDYFRQVVDTGKPYIDKPIIGRALKRPVLTLAVPVFATDGKLRAIMTGIIDLTAPNFLGFVNDASLTGDSEWFVFSRRDRLFIATTDPKRAMTALPPPGRSPIIDRMLAGFEGSLVAVSSEGIEKLYSGKQIPGTDWQILSALPTKLAFGPIRTTQQYLYACAALLSLIAALAIGLLVRRVLAPLTDATQVIGEMTEGQRDMAPLPVQRHDEIGRLLDNFNRLMVDRLAQEAALSDSERRFRRLIEGAPDAIFVQAHGCFAYVNDTALTLFGAQNASQLLGQPCLERVHPDDRANIAERIQRVNVERLANPPMEQTYLRLDGSSVAVEVSSVPFVHAGDHGALAFVRNISDKKRVAVELDQYRNHLEELVAERTLQLAAATQAADTANRAKSAFLATMSHEIRTPLNAVVGLTELLTESPLNRQQRDCADQIELAAEALRHLIDDILDFSRIEAGGLQLEEAPFSLNAILRTAAAVLTIGTRGKAIETLFDVAAEVPDTLLGDALRLQQILLNLISNAVKFTESGAIVIAVRRLAAQGETVTLQFAVRDSGIGIAPEQKERIFAAFIQADISTSRQYGGTGLGLAISARLAALMNGKIEVDSQLGRGSEFCCTVTLAQAQAENPPSPAADEVPSELHLLIVDDHPLARDILSRTCTNFGWRATAVDSGLAGLDELQRSAAAGKDYDLLLLDWHMPAQDGLVMLRQAMNTPGIGLPLVILMAPAFELEYAVAASDTLFLDGIVAKPLTPESLRAAVRRAYTGESNEFVALPGKADHRLAGLHLLVAEDNEINRNLMEKILGRAGAKVTLVNHGQAAIDALQVPGARFDAVLMDIQMPVMDGFTATRVIRQQLGLVDLPIIAVTANIVAEDQKESGQVGMTGLLTKPINIDDLLDLVLKESREHARTADETSALPNIALPGLDASAVQIFGGDAGAYDELLQQFASQQGHAAAEAHQRYAAGDRAGAARLVHELAGVTSFLRATQVPALAAATETALREGDDSALVALFEDLERAMQTLLASIQQFSAQLEAS